MARAEEQLKSEEIVIAARLSYHGSAAAQIVREINERFGTSFTVADLNNLIERFCENRA